MKKFIPLFVVALVLVGLGLAGGIVVDHSVKELPTTSGLDGSQGSADKATNASTADSNKTSSDDAKKSDDSSSADSSLFGVVARFFGIGQSQQSDANSQTQPPEPGRGSGSADPQYRLWRIFGTSASGLEFSGLFQSNTEQTYSYFKGKGFNTIRVPFDWNELQPDLYGDFDATAKQYVDQNIDWAKKNNMSVVLDAHNYGRRYIYRDGGFGDDFASSDHQHTFQMPYGDQDKANGTLTFRDFGRGVAGTFTNPVNPASGYRTTFDAKIDSFTGEAWNEFYMDVMYKNEQNRYSLTINPITNTWQLRQTIDGHMTVLASGSKVWNTGQYYSFAIDVNQSQAGKINVSVDGAPLFALNTVNTNAALSKGKVSMWPAGVKATIKHFVLDVAGDTSTGGPIERRIGDDGLTLDAWKDFWTKMSKEYKNNATVLGYDENEPHDMPVPTTPQNYSADVAAKNGIPVATATALGQAMVDALRAAGDTKFVIVNMDHWANTHYFSTQYGSNPEPWIKDTLAYPKVVYSGHYYFDADHSGLYDVGSTPRSNDAIRADVEPFFSWCQGRAVICYEGEFGVPNTPQWQPGLAYLLQLMKQYNIWWAQWAGGDIYSSPTTLQPSGTPTTDVLQMQTIENFLRS